MVDHDVLIAAPTSNSGSFATLAAKPLHAGPSHALDHELGEWWI
jgi:hypothetical protein